MLKSSSLCLYSSNFGTFCLKIEQFWPFEEISILSNGGHLGYSTALDGHNFERGPPKDHFSKVWLKLAQQFQRRRFSLNFWLKIEQFWPFEEISIFSNGGHLGYRTALTDTILKGDHPRIIPAKLDLDWLSSFRGEDFFLISSPLFSIFSLAAIMVGSRDHRTQFWKGAIQGSFHKSLVAIGPVVSEEKIFM